MNKVDKKELFKLVGKVSLVIHILTYLAIVWVKWDFYIPFKWVLDIPIMEAKERGGILTVFVFYYMVLFTVSCAHLDER